MAKKFNFIVFEDVGAKRGSYTISLARHNSFGFNSGFYKKEDIRDYSHVIISFDKGKKAVGFSFSKDSKAAGAWKISHGKNSANVVAHSFFNANGLVPSKLVGKYQPHQYTDPKIGKLFYIILQKKTKAKT
jgi:hypothetical protein